MSSARVATVAVVLGLVLASGACTATQDTSRAGGSLPVDHLRIGAPDPVGRLTSAAAHEMARQVDRLTDGSVVLVPVDDAVADVPHDFDKALIEQVRSGDLDLAIVPARAWDLVGVTSFQALSAPFLLASDELLAQVTQGGVAADMLAGLDGSGVTGLAVVPGGLRHVFRTGTPVLGPVDYVGLTLRTPHGLVPSSTFSMLGAQPVDTNGPAVHAGLVDGSIDAFETTYALADGFASPTTTAGDVTPFASAYTIVVNTDRFDRLSPSRREALRRSAGTARERIVSHAVSEDDAATAYCGAGSQIVVAGQATVDGLRWATAPVVTALRRDPVTRDLIDRILAADVALGEPRPTVKPCDGTPAPSATATRAPNVPARFPTGTYRRDVSVPDLQALGMSYYDAGQNAGVWTLTFKADGVTTTASARAARTPPTTVSWWSRSGTARRRDAVMRRTGSCSPRAGVSTAPT